VRDIVAEIMIPVTGTANAVLSGISALAVVFVATILFLLITRTRLGGIGLPELVILYSVWLGVSGYVAYRLFLILRSGHYSIGRVIGGTICILAVGYLLHSVKSRKKRLYGSTQIGVSMLLAAISCTDPLTSSL
jgi:hypothetical protein